MPSHDGAISRRHFTSRAAGALAFLAAHDLLIGRCAQPPAGVDPQGVGRAGTGPLIRSIMLQTAVPLAEMRAYYCDRFGMPEVESGPARLVLRAGASLVEFHSQTRSDTDPHEPSPLPLVTHERGPFYHFAFNIPPRKLRAARAWLLERTALVPTPAQLRDPDYPDDVRHFRSWNAHSLFFFDPAYNIVEFIARHDLPTDPAWTAGDTFTAADILYASEIGFVVEDPPRHGRMLHDCLGLRAYPPGADTWWAMGDERGLLLCLPKGRVFGENTATRKAFAVFETEAMVGLAQNAHTKPVAFEGLPYSVNIQP
ncbi:MAG: VOC family protein [Phycisphaerales bacterium]